MLRPRLPQGGVRPPCGAQFVVGAALGDAALLHHHHPVGGGGLAEPVRDDQCRTALQRALGGLLQPPGAGTAGLRGRLVEDGDRRVGQHQAGEGELLRAVRGQPVTAVADDGVQALGQRLRPAERAHPLQGLAQFLVGGVRAGQAQVVGERAGEDVHLLRDQRDRAPGLRGPATADLDPARRRLVDADDDLGERGLAGAAGTDEGDLLLGPEDQVHVAEHRPPRHVGVADALNGDGRNAGDVLRPCVVRGGGCRLVDDPDQPGQGGGRGLGVVQQHQRGVHRAEQTVEVQGRRRRRADRRGTAAHQQETGDQHGGQPGVLGHVQPAVEAQHQLHPAKCQVDGRTGAFGDPLGVPGLGPVGPHRRRAADRVEQLLLLGAGGDALLRVQRGGVADVPARGVRLHRQREQRRQQEPPVQHREGGQRQHDGQPRPHQFRQRGAHRLRHP